MRKLSLREKSVLDLIRRVIPLKKVIKQWFYYAGMKFLQSHKELTDEEELFLEEVTDFFVENLDELKEDVKFVKKVELEPINIKKKEKKVIV